MHPSLQRSGGPAPGRTLAERFEILEVRAGSPVVSACRARDLLSPGEVNLFCFQAEAIPAQRVLEHYRRDIGLLRTVVHPNVARIVDAGDDGPLYYVAIEASRGELLSEQLRQGAVLAGAGPGILEALARALSAIHSAGLAHLDVCPSRVLLTHDGIKLLPFDIERDVRQLRTADLSRFEYSAPEHILGRGAAYPADVYSAAAVVYRILAGFPPHAGAPLHIRCFSLPSAAPGAPTLTALLEQCLQPDPALRFQSAAALAEACSTLHARVQAPRSRTLMVLLRDEPQDPSTIVPILLSICGVLRGIHERGRAHRDPSPANIMLTDSGADMPSTEPPPPNATIMVDDPKYAAPEVLLSRLTNGGNAHVLADIYVLGFSAYELLAGRRQFDRQFDGIMEPQQHLAWMNWHADSARRLPPLRELAPSAPQPLCDLIDRMIQKDPSDRLHSLEEVENGLRRLEVRLEDTREFQIPVIGPQNTPKRKRRRGARVLVAIFVLLVAASVAAGWFVLHTFGFEERGIRAASVAAISALTGGRLNLASVVPTEQPSPPPRTLATPSGPMILIPAGEFTMGGDIVPNEKPVRQLTLPAYYVDQFEVTNTLYLQFCDRTGRPHPRAPRWAPDYLSRDSYPVLNVRWDDARSFCAAAGKRLPTEAEWEKAARGIAPASAGWRNWSVAGLANLGAGGRGTPAPVGTYTADVSPFGVSDMAGNVHEWVADDYALYPGNNATLPPSGKVVRGGSYAIPNAGVSPHWRASLDPALGGGRDVPVGFRCAADVPAAFALTKR